MIRSTSTSRPAAGRPTGPEASEGAAVAAPRGGKDGFYDGYPEWDREQIDSNSAWKNGLAAVLSSNSDGRVDLYASDPNNIVIRVRARDDAELDEIMRVYAVAHDAGVAKGKFEKAAEIRRALDV